MTRKTTQEKKAGPAEQQWRNHEQVSGPTEVELRHQDGPPADPNDLKNVAKQNKIAQRHEHEPDAPAPESQTEVSSTGQNDVRREQRPGK